MELAVVLAALPAPSRAGAEFKAGVAVRDVVPNPLLPTTASPFRPCLSASPKEATTWAAAVTSLKMKAEGPIKRKTAEMEELIQRMYKA